MNARHGRGSRAGLLFGIGAKLYFYLGFSLALILVAAYIGASALIETLEIEERMKTETFPRVLYALHLSQRVASLIATGRASLEAEGGQERAQRALELAEARRLFTVALTRARKAWPGAEVIDRVAARGAALNTRVDATAKQAPLVLPAIAPLEKALIEATQRVGMDTFSSAQTLRQRASSTLDNAILMFTVLNFAGFVTLAVSVWLFVRRVIVKRLGILSTSMRRMSGGDLEVPFHVGGNDELTDMGYALDIFREHAIEIQRLNLVEKLSVDLKEKNAALEAALGDLQRAQDQVVHQEKLAALGQLTAGVAHEIQNPLNFIKNFSVGSSRLVEELEELLEAPAQGDAEKEEIAEITTEIKDSLARVVKHSRRADNIVKAMLMHSRASSARRDEIEVNAVIAEYANLAYHSQRAHDRTFNLTIEKALAEDTGTISAIGQDIGRVFLNLVTNACQATAERAQNHEEGYEPTLKITSERTGDAVHVRIRDNGGGIPDEVRERMFEPFFTTKPSHTGTGLGLSISNDIVRAHGGEITVKSREGEFTELTVSLPGMALGERIPPAGAQDG